MAIRTAFLLQQAPGTDVEGDHIFIDYEIDGVPHLALTPHATLATIEALRRAFNRWSASAADVVDSGHYAASDDG